MTDSLNKFDNDKRGAALKATHPACPLGAPYIRADILHRVTEGSGLARSPRPGQAGKREAGIPLWAPSLHQGHRACNRGVPSASTARDSPSYV